MITLEMLGASSFIVILELKSFSCTTQSLNVNKVATYKHVTVSYH